ncbi:hypothetical protein CKAH01_11601 [Colletotrichum kahawae]|uniref:Uncharacterized protein n=1 Tax=Colletotrichum kahawae TaxID=34407 RepID=A0AAE0DC74_COLKA|nr:hypothetical protein CKAH01_11601 [Colletotrichum kahawae]
MALAPVTLSSRSEAIKSPHLRSSTRQSLQMDYSMASSQRNSSPHRFTTTPALLSPRGRLTPTSLNQPSPRGFHSEPYSPGLLPNHMTEEYSHSTQRPRKKPRTPRRTSKSHKRDQSENSLLAIGSWSDHSSHHDAHLSQAHHFHDAPLFDDGPDSKDLLAAPEDDFILFPDDTAEPALVPYEEALPPRAPRIPRLRTPDLAPLSTHVQFFPCLGDEREEDRVNETWYLAGRERVDSQMDDALAYMAGVEGRRKTLRN